MPAESRSGGEYFSTLASSGPCVHKIILNAQGYACGLLVDVECMRCVSLGRQTKAHMMCLYVCTCEFCVFVCVCVCVCMHTHNKQHITK